MHEARGLLTAVQLAAFLGVGASAVRHMVREHGIRSRGKAGRAHLYDASEVIRAVGAHDRAISRIRRPIRAKLTVEGGPTSTL